MADLRWRCLRDEERGQSLVEFALVVPFILVLLISVWEFGRAWNVQQVMTDAAREGARVAVVGNADNALVEATLRPRVESTINSALSLAAVDTANATINLTGIKGGQGTAATVFIEVPYEFVFLGPILDLVGSMYRGSGSSFNSTITLSTSFTMRNE